MSRILGLVVALLALSSGAANPAKADTFNFRIAAGHPPAIIYVALMRDDFVPRVKQKLQALGHTVNFTEAYSGSLLKIPETFEGARDGIVDFAGYCVCFEPSNLFLNNYPLWMPFDMQTGDGAIKLARAVHDNTPHLTRVYEEAGQKLLSIYGTDNYGLWTTFKWSRIDELKGHKLGAAGPNLPWVGKVGAVPVQETAPGAYQSMTTGLVEGMVLFPFDGVGLKYYEPAPHYTVVGFGAKGSVVMTMNKAKYDSLPPDVRQAIHDASRESEAVGGPFIDRTAVTSLAAVTENGGNVYYLSDAEKAKWAEALRDWPNEKAKEADARGLPGTKAMGFAVKHAEEVLGHKWPIRYAFN
jgi:TRAP-type C4-dicarboxylate transport system substrate-binding protein